MAPKIKGGKVRSLKALKQEVKKGGGSYSLKRIPANDSLTVRFLDEPEEWFQYLEYFSKEDGYFPDFEGLDPDVTEGLDRPSKRYLAAAVDVADNSPIALVLPKTLVTSLLKKYDKFNTILDRDYEVSKEGEGMGTVYDCIPEPPSKFNARRITAPDLMEALQASIPPQLGGAVDDDDDDDDADDDADEDTPIRSSRSGGGTRTKRKPVADDDDEAPATLRRKRPASKTTVTKKRPAGLRRK